MTHLDLISNRLAEDIISKLSEEATASGNGKIDYSNLINDLKYKLLIIDDYDMRKELVTDLYHAIKEEQLIKKYNSMYLDASDDSMVEELTGNLMEQIKLNFSTYFH